MKHLLLVVPAFLAGTAVAHPTPIAPTPVQSSAPVPVPTLARDRQLADLIRAHALSAVGVTLRVPGWPTATDRRAGDSPGVAQ